MADRPILALLLRTGAALCFATMAMLIKLASDRGATLPEIMVWRQGVPVIAILSYLLATRGLARLRTERLATHFRRSAIGMIGMVCNFTAVRLLTLADSVTLSFTAPFFAVMIAALVLREPVGPWRWGAVAMGFVGVLVIAQPGHAPIPLAGALAGLGAALIVGIVNYQIRDLGRTEQAIAVTFYFSAFGMPMAALGLPFTGAGHWGTLWPLLVAIGLAGTAGQLLLVASLRRGAVASVIVMDYTSLIWAAFYSWLVWDTFPGPATWLGAPLIIGAGLLIAWREHRLSRRSDPASSLEVD